MPQWLQTLWVSTSQRLPTLAVALGILIGGWFLAFVIQKLVHAGLKRTTLDDKIGNALGVQTGGKHGDRIERIVSKSVYYVLLGFVVVAFFGYLQIDAVTTPLVALLTEFAGAIPNLLKAVVIGFLGYLAAKLVRRLILGVLNKLALEKRMQKLTGEKEQVPLKVKKGKLAAEPATIAHTLADVSFWVIIVIVAIPVFEALKISALAAPLSSAFETITTYLPKVAGAAILLLVGYVAARIVRALVTGVLEKVGLDRLLGKVGFGSLAEDHSLSRALGTIAMTFVLLHFAISAVGRLDFEEVSGPLSVMLQTIYAYLPRLLVGCVLMIIGVFIARIGANLATRLLAAMGFNRLVAATGVYTATEASTIQDQRSKKIVDERIEKLESDLPNSEPTDAPDDLLSDSGTSGIKTPADITGMVVGAIIVLLFLRQVLGTLGLTGLAQLLDGFLTFLPHVVVAITVLGAGLWGGRWVRGRVDDLTRGSTDKLIRSLGLVAHVAVVAFAAMVGLQQLGVGQQLIALAFGLVLGAICLALALAFGLGGREVASKILNKQYNKHNP